MARIAGVNIPTNKLVVIGLTYIYGIGRKKAEEICAKVGIPAGKRVSDLTDDENRMPALPALAGRNERGHG